LSKIWSYENLGLVSIALLIAIGGVYSIKLISLLMPLLTFIIIWVQGGIKNVPLHAPSPIVFFLLLLSWAGLSIFWAENAIAALKTFLSLSVTFVFAFLFISCLMRATPELISKAYKVMKISGFLLICLVVFQAFLDSFHIEILKNIKGVPYMMKPTGSILGLMAFVGCAFLWINGNKVLSLFIFLLLILLICLTHCQTAFYGILLATGVFILSYAMPFWMTRISMVTSYTFLILSPLLYTHFFPPSRVIESPYFAWILNHSFFHRFLAWEFYSEKFFERPFLGWGMESSRYLSTEPYLAPGYENTFHPHNNGLQAYVELGIPGGVLYALSFAALFWLVGKHVKDRLSVAVCNATLTFAFVEAVITHNAWRNYWLSLVTLTTGLIILFLKVREGQLRAEVGHSEPSPAHEGEWGRR
jgi:exopolysaccharide production protein ExoQ